MKKTILAAALVLGSAMTAGTAPASAAAAPAAAGVAQAETGGLVHEARKVKIKKFPGKKLRIRKHRHGLVVRRWRHRPHYGSWIAGVTLGTIIAVAIANSVPPAPSPDLCWYWSNPARTHGYWDYCY